MRRELLPLLKLAGPVVLAEIGWMVMGIVDTLMVGRLGPAAIGATGLGNGVFIAIAIFGTGAQNVIIAITIPFIPRCARVVRSSALAIREMPYIDAARANGFSHNRIILRHMVPNVMAPFLIMITAFVGQAILIEASLSFLGLGVQEPVPAWGLMLRGGALEYAESAPWVAIFPGVAISLAVFGFNLFGDALRDWLDPKMKV